MNFRFQGPSNRANSPDVTRPENSPVVATARATLATGSLQEAPNSAPTKKKPPVNLHSAFRSASDAGTTRPGYPVLVYEETDICFRDMCWSPEPLNSTRDNNYFPKPPSNLIYAQTSAIEASCSNLFKSPILERPFKKSSSLDDKLHIERAPDDRSSILLYDSVSKRSDSYLHHNEEGESEDHDQHSFAQLQAPALNAYRASPVAESSLELNGSIYENSAPSPFSEFSKVRTDETMTPAEIEYARDDARSLTQMSHQNDDTIDLQFVESLLEICAMAKSRVTAAIELACDNDLLGETDELLELNDELYHAIQDGEITRQRVSQKKPAVAEEHNDIELEAFIEQKDVFSLICMLRAQQSDRRLGAALAILELVRIADEMARRPDEPTGRAQETIDLREEIRSSGGMHVLLSLFRIPGSTNDVKVVASLAVAYLLPSFVRSASQTPPDVGLKIIECLRVLSRAKQISPCGKILTQEECCKASARGLFLFWMNLLLPMLDSGNAAVDLFSLETRTFGVGMFQKRQESIELKELLEITVSLVIDMAKNDDAFAGEPSILTSLYTLVEQACLVEIARPISVREGMLNILIKWITGFDREKQNISVSALRHLTSIEDRYLAGWVHSQMLSEDALLQGLVRIIYDTGRSVSPDVQLAVAQILSSLCVAPHTRAAVVKADGIAVLIQFLCEYKASKRAALLSGQALIQLVACAITRSNVFGDEEMNDFGFAADEKLLGVE
jgi:hypothetical protein